MSISPRRPKTIATRAAIVALSATLVGASVAVTAPAQADSPEVSHRPTHVWVDPTQRNVDGNYEWSFSIHLPEITEAAVVSGSAPQFTTGVVTCQAPDPVDGSTLSCVGQGDAIPGEYTVDVELRVLAGVLYTWQVPLTVCPLTGCSDLFSLTITPDPIVVWANPNIYEQTYGTYTFNTDWNPSEVKIDDLVDAHGNPAPGIFDPISEPPANGHKFGFRGTFTQPGYYYSTVTMVDEFGGEHPAPITVRVCTPELCRDLLELPSTGVDAAAFIGAGGSALAVLAAGIWFVVARRRRA